jgi:PAS domain S-box-containing protein
MIDVKKENNELCDGLGQPPRYLLEFAKETKRLPPSEATTGEGVRAAPRLQAEVKSRFGVLPNFFRLTPESPEITANLWGFARFAYLDNPLPSLFKERLFVYLSRLCGVRYCIVRHLGFLVGLGRPSGDERSPVQNVEEALRLLRRTLPRGKQADPHVAHCAALDAPLAALPPPDSGMEEAIFTCAAHAFLQTPDTPRCLIALKRALGEVRFEHLMVFLAFVQTAHYWTKIHPELKFEEDVEQLLATHEPLAQCLLHDPDTVLCQISQKLFDQLHEGRHGALQAEGENEERLRQSSGKLNGAATEVRDSRYTALNLIEDSFQAERALRESEQRFRDFADTAPAMLRVSEADGSASFLSRGWYDFTGQIEAETLGLGWFEAVHPDDRAGSGETFLTANQRREPFALEYRLRHRDGEYRWCIDAGRPRFGPGGAFLGYIDSVIDITERKQAEEALRESEERFRTLADHAPVLIWVNGSAGCEFVNRSYLDFLGVASKDVQEMGWAKYVHPDDYENYVGGYLAAAEKRASFESELRLRRADGVYRRMRTVGFPRFSPAGDFLGYVGSTYDIEDLKQVQEEVSLLNLELENRVTEQTAELVHEINEREKLQAQLLQAQKMESIGLLAGGIAHDFNNLLNIIQGYAALWNDGAGDRAQTAESLTIINETVQRASGVVQQLLTLARKTESRLEPIGVNHLLDGLVKLLKETFPKTIEIKTAQAAELPAVLADSNQVTQALLNLCVNARDAMPSGGTLTLTTRLVDGAELKDSGGEKPGRYVRIEVKDTGMGMDPGVQGRIFEPFFTTKGTGQGTGLGLAVVYGIVQSHNGLIQVSSAPMQGTTFRVYLPATPSPERPMERSPKEDASRKSQTNRTILVVEDEAKMLRLLEKVLSKRGYQVLTAADGEEAIEVHRSHKDAIDIILLDLDLPKISGRDVLVKLKTENPDVKILIASGYLEPDLRSEIERAGLKHFIHKPYIPDDVVKIVQSL